MIKIEKEQIPNILTSLRIGFVPVLIASFYLSHLLCFFIFITLAATDFVDGYLARRFNCTSDFGRCFDPIGDKIAIISILIVLLNEKKAFFISVLLIILREIVVSGFREFCENSNITVNVSRFAKYKTFIQFLGVSFILIDVILFGNFILFVGALIGLTTMVDYMVSFRKVFFK